MGAVVAMQNDEDRELTAADIVACDDLEKEKVYIPEWKGSIWLRVMTASEAIKFQDAINGPQRKNAWVRIFALCAVDKNGDRLFTNDRLEDLQKKSTAVFLRLQKKLMQMNGFVDTPEQVQEQEDALKNG